jgi:predicted acyl esterase
MSPITPPVLEEQLVEGMRVLWDQAIPMDDGVVLRADVYLPATGVPVPAIVSMTAYGKNLPFSVGYEQNWRRTTAAAPEMVENTTAKYISFEVPDPEKWTRDGYAIVVLDARGCGRSPGTIDTWSAREADDFATAVDWVGEQDWCTGKVGTLGMSYLAVSQWLMASRNPKHLSAILPWEGLDDSLRACGYHGGIPSSFMRSWFESQIKAVQHGLAENGYRNPYTGVLVSGDTALPADELEANGQLHDIYRQHLAHPLDDGFYDDRRAVWDRITVPILAVSSWGNVGIHLRGATEAFMNAASPKKWLVLRGTDGFAGIYSDEGRALQRRFFDWALKGEGDWEQSQPPVSIGVRDVHDDHHFRDETTWPLATTEWTRRYFEVASESLVDEPAGPAEVVYRGFGDGIELKTEPFAEDSEFTGPLAARIWLSSSTEDVDLFLTLRLWDPQGEEVLFQGNADPKTPVAQGWLRASQRQLDESRTLPYRPFLAHTERQPLQPGEVYAVEVEIWPTSIAVPAGYRLGLKIAGTDFDHGQEGLAYGKLGQEMRGSSIWLHDDPAQRPAAVYDGDVTIYSGGDRASYLLLPEIPHR